MAKKPIDLDRVRKANARLDQLIKEHPELIGEASEKDWLDIIMDTTMEQQVYTVQEAADILKVHPETVKRAIKAGRLKAFKMGKGIRISKPDLAEFYRSYGGGKLFEDE